MSDNNERLEHVFRELARHVGEGILEDFVEEQIIAIEEQYRDETAIDLSSRQIRYLETQLRYCNANH